MITIDPPKPFSESKLWTYQREYFNQAGIDAWDGQVPFYVTSNPFIADCYAKIFIGLVKDWITAHPESKAHPFYLLELGTGSGRFSFYTLKSIVALLEEYALEDIKVCYVMSDFTDSNLKFWETHPRLQPFVEAGLLDFALFNVEQDKAMTLKNQSITLNKTTLQNPLTVFANYLFDTVIQDAFCVQEGKLSELYFKLDFKEKDLNDAGEPHDWSTVQIQYESHPLSTERYNDPLINTLLKEYEKKLEDTHFLLPTGALRVLKNLLALTGNQLLLVSSDKGYSNLASLDHLKPPAPSFHGSFSMMVNFHAVARYLELLGGKSFLPTPRDGLKTVVFGMGFDFKTMPLMRHVLNTYFESLNPADYFTLHKRVRDNLESYDLITLASHLTFAKWDPHVYLLMAKRLNQLLSDSPDATTLSFLTSKMDHILENYYALPGFGNIPFELGTFFYNAKNYQRALHYYQIALNDSEFFGAHYNAGLCYHYLNDRANAMTHFEKARQLDPNSQDVKDWISFLDKPIS